MERIGRRKLKIHAIKYVFLISLGMHHRKLRRIKKAAAVQSIYGDEVSQFVTSVSQIKANVGSAETTVRGSQSTVRCGHALAGSRCNVDYNARLLAEFRRRCAV